eukprot:7978888-Pyramimonas_sp.AAC.1
MQWYTMICDGLQYLCWAVGAEPQLQIGVEVKGGVVGTASGSTGVAVPGQVLEQLRFLLRSATPPL